MCTIAILLGILDGAPLVVAANRDELYARAALPPRRLADTGRARIAGGVDAQSGGTWLAVRSDGRFAAVTNQRALAPAPDGLRSRGLAVRELAESDDPEAYVAALDPTRYASMNLVWGDAGGAAIAYARREGGLEIERLGRGIHVLCNDRLGAPGFPRAARLTAALAGAPARWPDALPAIRAALADHTREAPGPSHLPAALARELTATCIHSPAYGTRSSTVIAARPGAIVAYDAADGPPCEAPFVDQRGLL
jgi:uncharacterized protein with NRDE domain